MRVSLRLRQIIYVFIAVAVVALGFPPSASALVVKDMLGPTQSALAGKGSGAWKKAGSRLRRIYAQFQEHEQQGKTTPFASDIPRVRVANGMILIDATAVSDSAQLLADLTRLGLNRSARYGAMVSGWIPLGMLDRAVALDSLRSVSASLKPVTNVGLVTSEGVAAMHANPVDVQNVTGAGVTVGILSDSVDKNTSAATTLSQDIASGDLPADGVNVLEDGTPDPSTGSCCTDEGRAMLQIVHDVAPGASLAFHTAFNGMADFAQGIVDLANAGANVIGDDVIYPAEPMFQDGIISQAVDTVKNQGVAYFSAAGNEARRSYESAFVSSGEHLYVQTCILTFCTELDRGVMHDFDPGPGVSYMQPVTIPDGSSLILVLQWDQPFASVSPGQGSQSDMDFYLVDSSLNIVAESTDDNIQNGDPIEVIQFAPPTSGGTYNLIIANYTGPQPGLMKYVNFGSYDITVDNFATDSSTIYGHMNAAGAEAVGAAYYLNTPAFNNSLSAAELEYFSSAGGTPILFNTQGNRLSSPEMRNKPGIVAPDGVDTTFFYPGVDLDSNGSPNFFGTSAATPHAAAVAALLKSANPALSPKQIYSTLESTAAAMVTRCSSISCSTSSSTATEGYDFDAGFGFIQADQAVAAIAPTALSLSLDPSSMTLSRHGRRAPTNGAVQVNVTASNTVSLSYSGLPRGSSAYFDDPTLNGSGTTNFHITVGPRGPRGTFTVTVPGTDQSNNNQSSTTLLLTVTK